MKVGTTPVPWFWLVEHQVKTSRGRQQSPGNGGASSNFSQRKKRGFLQQTAGSPQSSCIPEAGLNSPSLGPKWGWSYGAELDLPGLIPQGGWRAELSVHAEV